MKIKLVPRKHRRGLIAVSFNSTNKDRGVSKTERNRVTQHSGPKPLETAPT